MELQWQGSDRESNFELLRIIAMLMILVLHVGYHGGRLPVDYIAGHPIGAFFSQFFEVLAVAGVNIFVLISGWFGIRASVKGFCNLIFQVVFISLIAYLVMLGLGLTDLRSLPHGIFIIWFVWAYLLLYILSPMLNYFVAQATKRQYKVLLIAFFVFQTCCGWVYPFNNGFDNGYSTFSFIFLYLVAQYIHKYHYDENIKKVPVVWSLAEGGGIYLLISALLALSSLAVRYCNPMGLGEWMDLKIRNYINPLVIFNSIVLMVMFANININKSKIINHLAASSFAVILFHTSPFIKEQIYYRRSAELFETYNGVGYIGRMLLFVFFFYVMAVLIDQLRILCWKWLWSCMQRNTKIDKLKIE